MHSRPRLSAIELFLIAATVFVVIFVGYAVYRAQQEADVPLEQIELIPEEEPTVEERVPMPPEVNSADDLDAAIDALDELDHEAGQYEDGRLESESDSI